MAGYPPPSTPRKPRRWIWILVGLVLATALGGGAFAVDQHLTQRSDRLTFYKKVADLQKPAFVLITRDEIYLNGKPVATTRALANNDSPNWKVAALYKRLQTRRYRHNMTTDEAFHREVTLCAAKQTDFKVLKKVLHTCEFAGFSDQTVGLPEGSIPQEVSRMETSACSVMELQRQRPLTSGAPEKRIRINVLVGDDGFTITAGGERMVVARKGASLDHATLALRLKEIHDRLPAKDDLTAVAEDDVTTADILATLKTARKEFSHLSLVDPSAATRAAAQDPEDRLGGLIGDAVDGSGIGLGTLGTIGQGGGGSGAGYGRGTGGLRGRRAPAPRVIAGRAQVRGALDKQIIRRIIRRHINEVKYCYQKELQTRPGLDGRVVILFTIAGTGQVVMARVQQSTMKNRNVETCIARAVRRWLFPKPRGGGIVIVSYPFVLRTVGSK